jgi:hypothetical protein
MFENGEIEKVIKSFELTRKHLPRTGGSSDDMAPRENWKNRDYYNNGELNAQFLVFLAGYSAGKSMWRE